MLPLLRGSRVGRQWHQQGQTLKITAASSRGGLPSRMQQIGKVNTHACQTTLLPPYCTQGVDGDGHPAAKTKGAGNVKQTSTASPQPCNRPPTAQCCQHSASWASPTHGLVHKPAGGGGGGLGGGGRGEGGRSIGGGGLGRGGGGGLGRGGGGGGGLGRGGGRGEGGLGGGGRGEGGRGGGGGRGRGVPSTALTATLSLDSGRLDDPTFVTMK